MDLVLCEASFVWDGRGENIFGKFAPHFGCVWWFRLKFSCAISNRGKFSVPFFCLLYKVRVGVEIQKSE